MKTGWIDAHTHLNDKTFNEDFNQIMANIKEHNIIKINLVGVESEDAKRAIELKDQYDVFDVSIGLHPSHVETYLAPTMIEFYELAHDDRVICIGEIGLDFYWRKDNADIQEHIFIKQIELANDVKKPIMIHSRDAMDETIAILKKHKPQFGCVMHSFSGTTAQAKECVDLGFMISISGPVTFKKAQELREVVINTPIEQLLIETDAPYLTPEPYRGKRNEPSYVRFVGEKVAELKNISVDQCQQAMLENYQRVFHQQK